MDHPLRLTLVIGSLGSGGAERVLTSLANEWAHRGTEIILLTFTTGEDDYYQLDALVTRKTVALHWTSTNPISRGIDALRRVHKLRRAIIESEPDLVISFIDTTNVRVLASLIGTGLPVVVSERVDPRQHDPGPMWRFLRRMLYPHATRVVVQTTSVAQWAGGMVNTGRIRKIPNPVAEAGSHQRFAKVASSRKVVAMGRLVHQKGFDLLLDAWAELRNDRADWKLMIAGEGPERSALEARARSLNIQESVEFVGLKSDPAVWMQQAGLFVLSSRFEGFPNVLLEAMSCGLPVVSFDCNSGPSEIVRDGVDGALVPPADVQALSMAMRRLMKKPAERERLAERAVEVRERFSMQRVMAEWDDLVMDVLQR